MLESSGGGNVFWSSEFDCAQLKETTDHSYIGMQEAIEGGQFLWSIRTGKTAGAGTPPTAASTPRRRPRMPGRMTPSTTSTFSRTPPPGYELIDVDLNKEAGGKYVYLCYRN
ncbi:hypothetical protein [Kitasatospora sp. NPDC005856]|uniref:hypothetical protein n=1 Tax=Kitasatospora sp. NPDC005856 TaxID=3154566 RepID=UPI0033DBE773